MSGKPCYKLPVFFMCWSSSTVEQLICNQQVAGSIPISSSRSLSSFFCLAVGRYPSGQRGQTVNLLAKPTVVRIHLCPDSLFPSFASR